MKYRKASEVLPEEPLKEVQKYASGELLYIPKEESTSRNEWGKRYGGCCINKNAVKNHYDFHGILFMWCGSGSILSKGAEV